jgi:hypothetical protein
MLARRFSGDTAFAIFFAGVGLFWAVKSLEFPLWGGFAPDSGFLPLVFGSILFALSAAVAVLSIVAPDPYDQREPIRKSLLILAGLTATVAACGFVGFALPLFGMMLFLYAYVERLPLVRSVVVAAAGTAVLAIVFEHWLNVPMPLWPGDL